MGTGVCEAADCERDVYARGYCERHYRQQLRRGEVQPDRAPGLDLDPDPGLPCAEATGRNSASNGR